LDLLSSVETYPLRNLNKNYKAILEPSEGLYLKRFCGFL